MKRCKWFIGWFYDWVGQFDWCQLVGFGISGLLGIALSIFIFVHIDKVPATSFDYEQLEEQVDFIQQNPDSLLETDCTINVDSTIITVEFENENCRVTAEYDKNFELLSTSKEDKSNFWLWVLLFALFVGSIEFYVVGWIVSLVILLIEIAVALSLDRFKKLKAKSQRK